MLQAKSEKWIAVSVILGAITLVLALTIAMGGIPFDTGGPKVQIYFTSVAGIKDNSEVKFAGASVGRVSKIEVLPKEQWPSSGSNVYYVKLTAQLNKPLELGRDVRVEIRSDGLLGSKHIALIPGDPQAPPLDAHTLLYGQTPVDITELAAPAKEVLSNVMGITKKLDVELPGLLNKIDSVLAGGESLMQSVGTPEAKAQIQRLLSNLKVVSDNLKVTTTYTKALTATLAERPSSLLWGGTPNKVPTEKEILNSNKPLPGRLPKETKAPPKTSRK
jgi:ABC-type transporter Mla subunit MlaD